MLQDGQVLMTRQDGQVQLVGQGRQKQSGGFTAGMPFIFSSSTEGTRTRTPTIMGTSPPSPLLCSSRGSFYSLFVQPYHPSNFFPSGSSTMIFDNHFVPYLLSFVSLSLSLFLLLFSLFYRTCVRVRTCGFEWSVVLGRRSDGPILTRC